MNGKFAVSLLLVSCLAAGSSGLCAGQAPKTLTVQKMTFSRDKAGKETIALSCNQACVPELSSIEGANPRVVMDMKGVSLARPKVLNIKTAGKLVKDVRSYLDKPMRSLRIVLDMEPSKHYTVRPVQERSGKTYRLTIEEDTSLSEQKPVESRESGGSPLVREKHIMIFRPDLKRGEQGGKLTGTTPSPGAVAAEKAVKDLPSVEQGRAQLNAGEFAAAIETFTRILAAHPRERLIYRLRGNAHDNLNDRQKAVEDWTQAARLGDTAMQSYLDFLQVTWRENPAP
jgi:hypothetical protein